MSVAIPYGCAPEVPAPLVARLVRVESGGNPYAIGVVGGRLARQPANLPEAIATVRSLESMGANYSIGISQVNRVHFVRLGWNAAPAQGFDSCTNLRAGAEILRRCFIRARAAGVAGATLDGINAASRAALSCYYSGSLFVGEQLGYVTRVTGAAPPGRLLPPAATRSLFD